jgi:hypothetical protein
MQASDATEMRFVVEITTPRLIRHVGHPCGVSPKTGSEL